MVSGLKSGNEIVDDRAKTGFSVSSNANGAFDVLSITMTDADVPEATRLALATNLQDISQASVKNPDWAQKAMSQLIGEYATAGTNMTLDTARNFTTSIQGHLQQLYSSDDYASAGSNTAVASLRSINQEYASSFNPNRIWGGGFGAWTRQDNRNNQYGYKYNTGGFILGYDRQLCNFVFGVSAAYSSGQIKNNEGLTKTDVDTFNVGLYGGYRHPSGFFADVNAGFGTAWNKIKTSDILGDGRKEGKYRNHSYNAGLNLGYEFILPATSASSRASACSSAMSCRRAGRRRRSPPARSPTCTARATTTTSPSRFSSGSTRPSVSAAT